MDSPLQCERRLVRAQLSPYAYAGTAPAAIAALGRRALAGHNRSFRYPSH